MTEDLKWSNYDFTKIPYDDIVQVGQRTLLYRDIFTVSWLLGRFCNYRCSYCWPYARSDRKDHRPTELCLKTIDEIKRQARGNGFNSFHFSLSGGEPTFHPGYLDILGHLADDVPNTNYTSVHMTYSKSAYRTFRYKGEDAGLCRQVDPVSRTRCTNYNQYGHGS
ncbi:radical SAM protein [archaeon]|nr:radical SAM protein [archaeon]